jgi:hypothetical protein
VLGLTVFLVVTQDISFQPFATVVRNYWTWPSATIGFTWYGTPWIHFITLFITTLFILLSVTTSLITKSPVPRTPSVQPLVICELLSLLFATGSAAHRLWGAAGFAAGQALILGSFVIYSRRLLRRDVADADVDA